MKVSCVLFWKYAQKNTGECPSGHRKTTGFWFLLAILLAWPGEQV